MTFLHLMLGMTNFQNPLLRTLVPTVAAIFGIQAAVALPSIALQTERFYDASGAVTFLVAGFLSLRLPALRAGASLLPLAWGGLAANWRQLVLTGAVSIWSARLGSYLLERILAEGRDSRFDKIKTVPSKFALAWFGQAVWVSLCLMPVMAVNAVPARVLASNPGMKPLEGIGLIMAAVGFTIEATADWQKRRWLAEKRSKQHDEVFMTRGLFSRSQYPNYFGDITFWSGVATMAAGTLWSARTYTALGLPAGLAGRFGVAGLTFISPYFVHTILTKATGIPLSEAKYDKKYGHREDYQAWKRNTPRLVPKIL